MTICMFDEIAMSLKKSVISVWKIPRNTERSDNKTGAKYLDWKIGRLSEVEDGRSI